MNQQIESELREALSLRASLLPPEAGERLRGRDYRPRARRTTPRITLMSLGGVAAGTGVVASVVILGSSQPAFAGWTPTPRPATVGLTATVGDICRSRLTMSVLRGATATRDWKEVATDVRGPFTLSIYQSDSASATCLVGPSVIVVNQQSSHGGSSSVSGSSSESLMTGQHSGGSTSVAIGGNGTGDILHVSVTHLVATGQGPYTLVDGKAATGVTALTLDRSEGSPVQATTTNGWFLAWWPGNTTTTSATVTTPSGTTSQPLDLGSPGMPPVGSGTCARSMHGAGIGVSCAAGGPA